ncbi:MAG: crtZ [Labilithrix sp.]|nr:crtZ [Labilithrix sp.]
MAAHVLTGVLVALVVAALMEPWARLLHGRVWHRSLWPVHRSHHTRRRGWFERNDVLSAAHAPVAMVIVMVGCNLHGFAAAATIGLGAGMTLFGVAYFVLHDGFVHGRLPVRFLSRVGWLDRLRVAHAVHHARGEAPYGFFLGPRELRRSPRARAGRPTAPPPPDRAPASRRGTPRDGARLSGAENR